MQKIAQFDGLYEDVESHPDGEYIFTELLETRSKSFGWTIHPHIHAKLFQLFFITSGSFRFQEAGGERVLNGPCLLLIPPPLLHGFIYEQNCRGRILSISESIVRGLFPSSHATASMFESIVRVTSFDSTYTPETIGQLIRTIHDELSDNKIEKRMMLQVSLQHLFLVLFRISKERGTVNTRAKNLAIQYFQKFKQRIRQEGSTSSIAEIAKELAITPVHLNRVCRLVSGKSASQLMQEHVLDEAQKYLTNTPYTVSEIANLLHFEYPNYFARFFRKHTGTSPSQFRDRSMRVL